MLSQAIPRARSLLYFSLKEYIPLLFSERSQAGLEKAMKWDFQKVPIQGLLREFIYLLGGALLGLITHKLDYKLGNGFQNRTITTN